MSIYEIYPIYQSEVGCRWMTVEAESPERATAWANVLIPTPHREISGTVLAWQAIPVEYPDTVRHYQDGNTENIAKPYAKS